MADSEKQVESVSTVSVKTVQPADTEVNRDAYIGVDPIYQNYANDTDKPFTGEEEEKLDTEQTEDAGKTGNTATSEGDQTPSATLSHAPQGDDSGESKDESEGTEPKLEKAPTPTKASAKK